MDRFTQSDWVTIAVALFLVRFLASEAVFQRAKYTASAVHFPVGFGLRLLLRLGGPLGVLIGYKLSKQAANWFDWAEATLAVAMGFFVC